MILGNHLLPYVKNKIAIVQKQNGSFKKQSNNQRSRIQTGGEI